MARNLLGRWPLLYARIYGLLFNERAQTLAEYGLVITIIAVGVTIPTLLLFRGMLISAYDSARECLDGVC
jgi:hypothetical protein